MSRAIAQIGQQQRPARTEINGVAIPIRNTLEVIRYSKTRRSRKLQQRISVIALARKSAGVERRIKRAISRRQINISRRIRGRPRTAHPDSASAAIRSDI